MGVTNPFPSPDAIARAELLTRERFVYEGESLEEALAPGSARRRALDAAVDEVSAGHTVPSLEWRREFSLLLGLERLLSEEETQLVDGTVLSAHQVDALSGTLTALLADAQRIGNGNGAANGTSGTSPTNGNGTGASNGANRSSTANRRAASATGNGADQAGESTATRRGRTGRRPTTRTTASSTRSPRTGRTPTTMTPASSKRRPRTPTRTNASGSSTRPAPARPSRRSGSSRPAARAAC